MFLTLHCPSLSPLPGWCLLALAIAASPPSAQALPPPRDLGLNAPPQVQTLFETPLPTPQVNAETPSDWSLTVPGLWWANQQFGDKMVMNWFAYRQPQARNSQVRAIVRPDLWSRYTYFERFAFLKRFGLTTSAAGYHLLVLDRQNYLLGAYTCQFPAQVQPAPLYPWRYQSSVSALQAPCNVWISPVYGVELF